MFLMNDVHEDGPVVFESRWAMSYLRGPLTRAQIKTLMDPVKASRPEAPSPRTKGAAASAGARGVSSDRPLIAPAIAQYFLPVRGAGDASAVRYRAMALGAGQVHFSDPKSGVDSTEDVLVLAPISDEPEPLRWDDARPAGVALSDLERDPQPGAAFEAPASPASDPKSWARFSSDFAAWLFRTRRLDLLGSPSAAEMSKPGESERDFRARLQQKAREQRDSGTEALRARYATRIAALEERKRRAEQAVDREKQQATSQGLQTAISIGATVLGALLGRKAISATNIGRATTAARGAGRTVQQAGDVTRAKENVAALDAQIAALNAELQAELDQRAAAADPLTEKLETVTVRPKKSDVSVRSVSLAWAPFRGEGANAAPAWE
jgi:hypothetical protein